MKSTGWMGWLTGIEPVQTIFAGVCGGINPFKINSLQIIRPQKSPTIRYLPPRLPPSLEVSR